MIGPIDHVVEAFAFSQFGEADTDRRSGDRSGEGARYVAEAAFGRREERADQPTDKLIAAVANQDVVGTQTPSKRRTQLAQQPVAVGVTVRVIDSLQMVNVDERDDQRFPGSVCPIERLTELIAAGVA